MDGATLSELLHNRGINIRYLGKVCNLLAKVKQLEYLHSIAVNEIISRAIKHIFTIYLQVLVCFIRNVAKIFMFFKFQGTEIMNLSLAISHFLNCLFYNGTITNPIPSVDEVSEGIYFSQTFEILFVAVTEQKQQETKQEAR